MPIILQRQIKQIPVLEVVKAAKRHEALPLIVYYHGWRSAKELVLTQARKLANAGFRVVLPDAFNHGKRLQSVSEIPSWTFWQSIQNNLIEFDLIINYFRKLKLIYNDLIGVGGVSMGGMTTTALLTHHPEIKVAACIMGSADLIAFKEGVKIRAKQLDLPLPLEIDDLLAWLKYYDLASQMSKIDGRPLLVWHGTKDEKIPFRQVDRVFGNLKQSNIDYRVTQDATHIVKIPLMNEITDFFVKHLV